MKLFFKRMLCFSLALMLMVSTCQCLAKGARFVYYSDVKRSDWFFNDVVETTRIGCFTGTGKTTFSPGSTLTRAMFVTSVGRMLGVLPEYYQGSTGFTDAPAGQWFSPYVIWAVENNITYGTSKKTFSPNKEITREEMAVLICRCCSVLKLKLKSTDNTTSKFKDINSASLWAKGSVERMRRTGIIRGDAQGRFNPQALASRAEGAAILRRMVEATDLTVRYNNSFLPDTRIFAHAGGAYEISKGSNSLEALQSAYSKGIMFCEIDFNFTSDGKLACIHDWDKRFSQQITNGAPSLSDFLQMKIYGNYTPLWLGSLADFLYEHPEMYIITDVKDDNVAAMKAIKAHCPDLIDRFIVQIYSESEYKPINQLGFDQIIYSLYKLGWKEKTDTTRIGNFVKNKDIVGITFSYELYGVSNYVEKLKKIGIPLFVFTVNDKAVQKKLYKDGIFGIYTDSLK